MTVAKGIGNGFPLAAVITRGDIAASLSKAGYFNTFGGNPLACVVGSTVLDVIDEENLQENCKELGLVLIKGLMRLMNKYGIIGDVRGKGLMIGVELINQVNVNLINLSWDYMIFGHNWISRLIL